MDKKGKIITLSIILLDIMFGLLVRNSIADFYYSQRIKNLPTLDRADFKNIVKEIKKEIFTPAPLNVGGEERDTFLTRSKVNAQTNIQRYNNGILPPLIENKKLNAAAQAKAEDMFKNQ